MKTYLVAWNPKKWDWIDFDQDFDSCRKHGFFDEAWSCRNSHVKINDRLFLIKQGKEPKGIIASGWATSEPYQGEHYSDPSKNAPHVDARWDMLLHPNREPILSRQRLSEPDLRGMHWDTQASGIIIPPAIADTLEQTWSDFLTRRGYSPISLPDEIPTPSQYFEGAVRQISVNAYERDPSARRACIDHYGLACTVCGFSFESVYGDLGKYYIHVHHVRPLAAIGKRYAVDPVADLRPVCPNCHAMVHRRNPPLSIEELKIKTNIYKIPASQPPTP